jgi:hypothetical protein
MTKKQMLIMLGNENTIDYGVLVEQLADDDEMFHYIRDNPVSKDMMDKVQSWIDDNF